MLEPEQRASLKCIFEETLATHCFEDCVIPFMLDVKLARLDSVVIVSFVPHGIDDRLSSKA